ncbi:Adenylate cyclase type 3 [Lamellibrachia satsuma]|nr:Adenylate cyclase type 3 [Lamellibrachia satsuma]
MATTGEIEGDAAVDTLHSFLPCWPQWGFEDRGQERLFQSYVRQIKWDAIDVVFVAGLVFDAFAILLHVLSVDKLSLLLLAVMTVAACVNSTMLVLFKRKVNFPAFYRLVPYVAWLFFMGQFFVVLLAGGEMLVPSSLVEWQLLSIYFVHAVLPVQTRMCLLLNVTSCVLLSFVSRRDYIESPIFKTANMIGANVLLYVCASAIGLAVHRVTDRSLRSSFLDRKESLSVSAEIETTSREEEDLLLSVLPKHVADEMAQDKTDLGGQFRRICMNRHENVR